MSNVPKEFLGTRGVFLCFTVIAVTERDHVTEHTELRGVTVRVERDERPLSSVYLSTHFFRFHSRDTVSSLTLTVTGDWVTAHASAVRMSLTIYLLF